MRSQLNLNFLLLTTLQEKLFKVAGVPMVDNCMDGYNSCIFAYGQVNVVVIALLILSCFVLNFLEVEILYSYLLVIYSQYDHSQI